jgi:hypothetical protein
VVERVESQVVHEVGIESHLREKRQQKHRTQSRTSRSNVVPRK